MLSIKEQVELFDTLTTLGGERIDELVKDSKLENPTEKEIFKLLEKDDVSTAISVILGYAMSNEARLIATLDVISERVFGEEPQFKV